MTGNNTNWHELSGFQRDLLRTLLTLDSDTEHVSGQDIKRRLDAERGHEINHGRLYPNLDTLIDHGLVEKGTIDERTNDYQPTGKACELVRRELQSWMAAVDTEQPLAGGVGR